MYCPKCGHQAASNNVRFCPGCGFRLEGVAELLANNGLFAADEENHPKPRRSMVKRGALLGVTLMFIITLLIIPLPRRTDEAMIIYSFFWAALMAIIGISGYVKRLFTKIFSEEQSTPPKKIASPRGPTLPAAHSPSVPNSGQQLVDTTKIAQLSSITEQTTSRLNKV